MRKVFKKVSAEQINAFSPDLFAGVESAIAEGHDNLTGIIWSDSCAKLMMPSALAIGALEGTYIPPFKEALSYANFESVALFGSLGAYGIAQAGNAKALNMLELISSLPNLGPLKDASILKHDCVSVSNRMGAAACRMALYPELGLQLVTGLPTSFHDLLGLDSNGQQSFEFSYNQSQARYGDLAGADLRRMILDKTDKRSGLDAADVMPQAGALLVALTVTQPQIWIEQGRDPHAVADIIDRRIRGFWSMARMSSQVIDELVETAIQTAFAPFRELRDISNSSFWGISLEACRSMGPAQNYDIAAQFPVITGGTMTLFQPRVRKFSDKGPNPFNAIGDLEFATKLLEVPWQEAAVSGIADRVSVLSLGRNKSPGQLLSIETTKNSLARWHLMHERATAKHPLVPGFVSWGDFLEGAQWAEVFARKIKRPGDNHMHVFLREFATCQATQFDEIAYEVLASPSRKAAHAALAPHVTSGMKSFQLVSEAYRDRGFAKDLGL